MIIAIYYRTWYFLLFRTNCPSTYHQLEHVFRRWGCHLKASNLFMRQMASSWKKTKSNYFSIPLPKLPVVFNVLSLSPVPCWNSFPRHSCSLPRGSAGWCDIVMWQCCCSLGLLVSSGQKQRGTRPLLWKLSDLRVPAAASTLEPLQRHPVQFLTAGFCVWWSQTGVGCLSTSWKCLHATQKETSSSSFSSDPSLFLHKQHSPPSLKTPPNAPVWIACNDPLRRALLLEMQT